MVIPPYPPRYALIRTVVASFFVTFISFTLLFSYHPPFKTTLSKFSPFSTPPYTSAIIYLVWLSHPDELLELLASVNAYLPLRDPWPIILFHTGDFDETPVQDDFLASSFALSLIHSPFTTFMNYLCFAQVIITCVHSTPQKYSSIHAYEMSRTTTHGYQFSLP